jgi:hypothetical protein
MITGVHEGFCELGLMIGCLTLRFRRNATSAEIRIHQDKELTPPRNVEVSVSRFFGEKFTEFFEADEFALDDQGNHQLRGQDFPLDLFLGLEKGEMKIEVKFLDQ